MGARLAERGVDPEVAQQKLAETLETIKRYQHAMGFFFGVLIMEFLAWPLLSIDVVDVGGNEPDKTWSFTLFGALINYKTGLTVCWIFSIVVLDGYDGSMFWRPGGWMLP